MLKFYLAASMYACCNFDCKRSTASLIKYFFISALLFGPPGRATAQIPMHDLPASYVRALEVVGAQQCAKAPRFIDGPLSIFAIADVRVECVIVKDSVIGPRVAFNIRTSSKIIRCILTIPYNYDSNSKGHILFLRAIGGPGGDVLDTSEDKIYVDAIGGNGLLLSIAYRGTKFNINYPLPSMDDASSEFNDVCDFLYKISPKKPNIYLTGESLGALIVNNSIGGVCGKVVKGVVNISGPLDVPSIVAKRLEDNEKILGIRDPLKYVVRQESVLGGGKFGSFMLVPSADLFRSFFSDRQWQADPVALISNLHIPALIIMGSLDTDMGVRQMSRLAGRDNIYTVSVEGMSHSPRQNDVFTISSAISNFLSINK